LFLVQSWLCTSLHIKDSKTRVGGLPWCAKIVHVCIFACVYVCMCMCVCVCACCIYSCECHVLWCTHWCTCVNTSTLHVDILQNVDVQWVMSSNVE